MTDKNIIIGIEADDNASGIIAAASAKISDSLKSVESAQSSLSQALTASVAPLTQTEQGQLSAADAAVKLAGAQSQVASKQSDLSSAIRQYGADSTQASVALRDLNQAQQQLSSVTPQVTGAIQQQSINYKDLAISVSGVATGIFSLYMSYDMIEKASVQVDKAQITVASTANSAKKAQDAYNDAVAKYGPNSAEAQQKATDLSIANDKAAFATERASMAENNYSNSMARGALAVIPGVITLTSSLSKTVEALTTSTSLGAVAEGAASWAKMLAVAPTATLTAAQWQLNAAMDANPIGIIILAIAGLVAAFAAAYTYIKPFHDAVNELGKTLMDALKPAIDVIYGALKWLWDTVLVPLGNFLLTVFIDEIKAVGYAIKLVADGIGALASWIGESWAKLTGTFKDSVAKGMEAQLAVVQEGLDKQTAEVNKQYDEMVSTVDSAYEAENQAALDFWNSRLSQEVTGWDKVLKTANEQSDALVDAVTKGLKDKDNAIEDDSDTQLKAMQSSFNDQLDAINSFYDDVIATTQDKLDQIRGARAKDLDDLELSYLLQKQAMEKTLDAQGSTLTEEQKNSVMQAITQKYNDSKSAISDKYRIQELEAEKKNNDNIASAETARAAALADAKAKEDALELAALNTKNEKLAQAERDANAEIAKINRDRNATIKEIEADRDEIEKKHTEDLKILAKQREDALTAIANQGEMDRYNIIKAANDKLGLPTAPFDYSKIINPVTPLPAQPGSSYAPGGSLSPWQPLPLGVIPHFAEGGIVNSPTLALIGEGGVPEKVTPLSRFGDESDKRVTQTNTIYVHISVGNISSEIDLEDAKAKILGGVVDGVGRRK